MADAFIGKTQTQVTCLTCLTVNTREDDFVDIQIQPGKDSLTDAIKTSFQTEELSGDN